MSALDSIAGVAIGGYLVSVAMNGNSQALLAQMKKDKAFLKWAIAVGVLAYAYNMPNMGEPVAIIIFIAFLALFLQNGTKISTQASKFWSLLGGGS